MHDLGKLTVFMPASKFADDLSVLDGRFRHFPAIVVPLGARTVGNAFHKCFANLHHAIVKPPSPFFRCTTSASSPFSCQRRNSPTTFPFWMVASDISRPLSYHLVRAPWETPSTNVSRICITPLLNHPRHFSDARPRQAHRFHASVEIRRRPFRSGWSLQTFPGHCRTTWCAHRGKRLPQMFRESASRHC